MSADHPELAPIEPLSLIAAIFGRQLNPPPPLVPSVWASQNLIVPDGPRAGEPWDMALTPYVPEIIDCLGPDSGNTFACVRKSVQTGISIAALALAGSYIAGAPCRIGYALPTIDLMWEFNAEKLDPIIRDTPALSKLIRPNNSRSATGSTAVRKKFPGGSLVLLNANSGADLRSKTLKVGIGDEVDQWQWDLDGQGDPFKLFEGRFVSFHATGDYRILALSTPRLKNASRIDDMFIAGDQRYWNIICPHCHTEIVLKFQYLKFNKAPPYKAYYVTQCCGCEIHHDDKARLVRAGRFVATNAEGAYPSFHVDAIISQLTTWDHLAKEFVNINGAEKNERSFVNLWLGLAYEVHGDLTDMQRLLARREDYREKFIPKEALLVVCGADIQHKGIWVEVVAFSPDRQSWSIYIDYLEGDTTDPSEGAFKLLTALYDELFQAAAGLARKIDAMAVDAGDGGRFNQVCEWCRHRPRAFAIKGQPGWQTAAIGPASYVTTTWRGKTIKNGSALYPIGTWNLKAELLTNLDKAGVKEGKTENPNGYCHHNQHNGETYFTHLQSEHLVDKVVNGRNTKAWEQINVNNHYFDARVYAMAMAEKLGLTRNTVDDWKELAKRLKVDGYDISVGAHTTAANEVRQQRLSELPPIKRRRMISKGF